MWRVEWVGGGGLGPAGTPWTDANSYRQTGDRHRLKSIHERKDPARDAISFVGNIKGTVT